MNEGVKLFQEKKIAQYKEDLIGKTKYANELLEIVSEKKQRIEDIEGEIARVDQLKVNYLNIGRYKVPKL